MDDLVFAGGFDRPLSDHVQSYIRAAVSDNTRRAYRADLGHFLDWGGVIPASETLVAEYLAAHAGVLAVATLERRLATLSKVHGIRGLPSPTASPLVRMTMRGIRRAHGSPQQRVAPATREDVLAMVAGLGDGLKDTRDRALLLVGFAGAFRRSELVAIDVGDVDWRPQGIVLTVRRSKTDQAGRGRQVAIPHARGGACPVSALRGWLAAAGIRDGPVFRAVDRHGRVSDRRLSPEAVALVIKQRAKAAGLDPDAYSGHSLRAGLATSAAAAGVPIWNIRRQTGHTSDAMLKRYVRAGEAFANDALGALLQM